MTHPVVTDIPTLLKWADTKRHHDGLTLEELAKAIDVKPSALGHWLAGRRKIPSDKLIPLLAALGRDMALLNRQPTLTDGSPQPAGKTP